MPDCGVYLHWPAEGESWIHPEDVATVRQLIPSRRVLRRLHWDGRYYQLQYGRHRMRVRPTLWTRVEGVDLEVGEQVELLSKMGKNDAGIYRIAEIAFLPQVQQVVYYLQRGDLRMNHPFRREDLRPLHVRHRLRSDFYKFEPPGFDRSADIELLDVGDLEADDER
ncbi:MAG: hypothetical protein D6753_10995 [Planctomycetota bacterium]|nr:MAG: hypothetical protein D6753_10995 [Planctomycetota bacterium]